MLFHRIGDVAKDYVGDKNCLILQICNCVSCKIHKNSLGGNLYQTLPYSSPYPDRKYLHPHTNLAQPNFRDIPGTITFKFPPRENSSKPIICCLYAQYDMGNGTKKYYAKSRFVDEQYLYMIERDTKKDRLEYFKSCLKCLHLELISPKIQQLVDNTINKIIIPKFIGCGLGGGDWKEYYSAIIDFNKNITMSNTNIDVVIVEKK